MSDTSGNPVPDNYRQGTDAAAQLYRINLYAADAHDYDTGESGPIGRMILDGVLVPDARLQEIADAWRKYHSPAGWAEGIVPLFGLLGALTEE